MWTGTCQQLRKGNAVKMTLHQLIMENVGFSASDGCGNEVLIQSG